MDRGLDLGTVAENGIIVHADVDLIDRIYLKLALNEAYEPLHTR
jgi:hypothetical protein